MDGRLGMTSLLSAWLGVRFARATIVPPARWNRVVAAGPASLPVHDSCLVAQRRRRSQRRPCRRSLACRCRIAACPVSSKGPARADEFRPLIRNDGGETPRPALAADLRSRRSEALSRDGAFEIGRQVGLPDEAHATTR
jgi:hypothetical protein